MVDKTTATVLVQKDADEDDSEHWSLIAGAKRVFKDCDDLEFYYHSVMVNEDRDEPVLALSSEEGQQRLTERLEQTIDAKEHYLTKIVEEVEQAETLRDAAQSYNVFNSSRKLGMYPQPESAFLYDGSNHSFSDPLINQDRVDDIVDRYGEDELYLVELVLTY